MKCNSSSLFVSVLPEHHKMPTIERYPKHHKLTTIERYRKICVFFCWGVFFFASPSFGVVFSYRIRGRRVHLPKDMNGSGQFITTNPPR